MDWQTIETAPMEQASFAWQTMPLLFTDGVMVKMGFVCGKKHDGSWEIDNALTSDDERYGRDPLGFKPTHWMPLPEPPRP
jgi:hypothetical protein